LLLNRIDTPLEFEEKDEKKQSNPHIDLILDSISEVKCDYLHVNNPNARDKLIEIVDQCSLVDPFRELFPDLQRYTWRKKTPFKQARLDFFLSKVSISFNKSLSILSLSFLL
jgi:exonuclease III